MRATFAKGRVEAFSDGVLAIIITIMVLEMKVPHGEGHAGWADLRPVAPVLLSYILSFAYVGIYWNNHHHMLHAARTVSGGVLWANLHLLFWLSLIPFVTGWMGENHFGSAPAALYGVVLLMSGVAYTVLQTALARLHGNESALARAVGRDFKGKASLVMYLAAIGVSFVAPWGAVALYALVAVMWVVPDRRIERELAGARGEH